MRTPLSYGWLALIALVAADAVAQEPDPRITPASDEAERAIAAFRKPDGVEVSLFAAEPMLANPVAFDIDGKGRHYVIETFRAWDGVTDDRSHMNWLVDDFASTTVADRVAMYRKYLTPEEFAQYGAQDDRIRRIVDEDGDGRADEANVFADGFQDQAAGIGSGILVADPSTVYYTCIPNLWLLKDADRDGVSDARTALSTGYGVRVSFLGHDLHGLLLGPDGRLYFSLGDRGLNVLAIDGRSVQQLDSGSVLRCELDGSGLEIVATGFRNPQELEFDDRGNLFSVDNNSDSGDKARLVQIVEGGDSGWRMGWQYIERPNSRGPWNSERMWEPRNDEQPAYIVPPLANISDGPSGLAFNPGTALAERHRGRFFLADFRGASGISGVRSFALEPDGASFKIASEDQFIWGICATDVAFGPEGAFYITDWIGGWAKPGKGRIYRLDDPSASDDPMRAEVAGLLGSGLADRSPAELAGLLRHADRRVRLQAQHTLAGAAATEWKAGNENSPALVAIVGELAADRPIVARRHAIWGLCEAVRRAGVGGAFPAAGAAVLAQAGVQLLGDDDPEVREQFARACLPLVGALSTPQGSATIAKLVEALGDPVPSVRFHAAIALGRLGQPATVEPMLAMIRLNADADAYLRHAGVMGLAGSASIATLMGLLGDESPAVRLAALLALRRQSSPAIAQSLGDNDPRIVVEAARAIYDLGMLDAMPALAALPIEAETSEALARRVIAAAERIGDVRRLAAIAATKELESPLRAEALDALGDWAEPAPLDRITGLYSPLPPRNPAAASMAMAEVLPPILENAPEAVMRPAIAGAGRLGIATAIEAIAEIAADESRTTRTRVESLKALEALDAPGLDAIVFKALDDRRDAIRSESLRILAARRPELAVEPLSKALETGAEREKQAAFATVAGLDAPEADALLTTWMDRLLAGEVDPAVRLDLLEAAGRRDSDALRSLLERYEAARPTNDPLAAYRETLEGGDPSAGGTVFREKAEVSCVRCHKVRGEGGEVGPELSGLPSEKDREYLLEAIVAPNARIAEGFETVVVATSDGRVIAGVRKGRGREGPDSHHRRGRDRRHPHRPDRGTPTGRLRHAGRHPPEPHEVRDPRPRGLSQLTPLRLRPSIETPSPPARPDHPGRAGFVPTLAIVAINWQVGGFANFLPIWENREIGRNNRTRSSGVDMSATSSPAAEPSTRPRKPPRTWAARIWIGMGVGTWFKTLARHGFAVHPSQWHTALLMPALGTVHSLLGLVEKAVYARSLPSAEDLEAPIFVVGHWRTGTTWLHELLTADPRHAFPNTYQCFEPKHFLLSERLLKSWEWLIPSRRPMDEMDMGFDKPQEDEFALALLGQPSPYLTIAFPNRKHHDEAYLDVESLPSRARRSWERTFLGFLRRVSYRRPGRLVLKSPTHSCRIPTLLRLFPDARFVHIVRDPCEVFPSTVHLWKSLYRKQGLQKPRFEGLEARVFGDGRRLYERLEAGRRLVSPDRFLEVRYEDLVEDPIGEVERIYDRLDLGDFAPARPGVERLAAERSGYKTNHYSRDEALRSEIESEWGEIIERYGYDREIAFSSDSRTRAAS